MDLRNQVKHFLRMCGHAMVSTVHERLDRMEQRANEVEASLLQASIHTVETLHAMTDAVVVQARDGKIHSPELGLMEFLYSYLPERTALDVGAATGETCAALLDMGYDVYAFEADPTRFQQLERRFKKNARLHLFPVDVGSARAETHPPLAEAVAAYSADRAPGRERLALEPFETVPREELDRLHHSSAIPEKIGLLRIDPTVDSLAVIRGMGVHTYPVVAAAFRDRESNTHVRPSAVETLVDEMRGRGYPWHIVLYRPADRDRVAFYSNVRHTVPYSSGNIFFFRSHPTFLRADQWCQSLLTVTYFGPAKATPKLRAGEAGEVR